MGQQTMDARHSHVIDVLDVVSHQLSGDDRLFGNWDVAGSCRHNDDHSLAVLFAVALQGDGAGERTIFRLGHDRGHGGILFLGGASGQDVASVRRQALENASHLEGSFSLGKNYLRNSLSEGPMVVDLGKAQIFKRKMA